MRCHAEVVPQAESVTHHLAAPVLRHKVFKPGYACIASVRTYFASLPAPLRDDELIVVGDRIFTDVVMANRMARRRTAPKPDEPPHKTAEKVGENAPVERAVRPSSPSRTGPLSVWTDGVWEREAIAMRYLEKSFMRGVQRYVVPDNGVAVRGGDASRFVKPDVIAEAPPSIEKVSLAKRLWNRIRRT